MTALGSSDTGVANLGCLPARSYVRFEEGFACQLSAGGLTSLAAPARLAGTRPFSGISGASSLTWLRRCGFRRCCDAALALARDQLASQRQVASAGLLSRKFSATETGASFERMHRG